MIFNNYGKTEKNTDMKTFYRITANETGVVLLKTRKIAKALRWWLRKNGYDYESTFFIS